MSKISRNLSILMLVNHDNSVSLANATGLSRATVDNVRSGKYNSTRLGTINVIAQHYGVPVDYFINGEIELKCGEWHKVV